MPVEARSSAEVALKLMRQGADVQVVVVGLGLNARVVTQTSSGSTWRGRLIGDVDAVLSQGPEQVSMLRAGLASIRLDASNGGFELQIEATSGRSLSKPSISSNGKDLVFTFLGLPTASQQSRGQTTRLDLRRPGRVQQSAYVPPLRARAVAPPVGDMAVGSMLISNRSYVNVSGPQVSLNLSNAPAKDALMSLARLGGYGFVFIGGANVDSDSQASQSAAGRNVTMSFREENFDRALNSVLMASGLQAKLDGRTLLVGESVSGKTFGPQMSKVYRLNQASAGSAADYLASLGAQINKVSVVSTANSGGDNVGNGTGIRVDTQAASTFTDVETYGASTGPLRGLTGTTDSRLQTVTLVGETQTIAIAEGYLKQIDLRQRQVAVKVQILSVNLTNDKSIDSSFSARIGDKFIVSENGNAHLNFGQNKPGSSVGTGIYSGQSNPPPQTGEYAYEPEPMYRQSDDTFYSYLNSVIISSSAKILAQPTLLVQEGEEAKVETGESVITGVESTETSNGSVQFTNQRENAGLGLALKVSKIDDNGFVTMNVSPEISVPIPAGRQQGVSIFNISGRKLNSGSIRLRDRQTLILTGVIQDSDRQQATKWPIIGDLPLIGQFFRSSASNRQKNELVIIVTPTILDDSEGGTYGYGYRPSIHESRQLMGSS